MTTRTVLDVKVLSNSIQTIYERYRTVPNVLRFAPADMEAIFTLTRDKENWSFLPATITERDTFGEWCHIRLVRDRNVTPGHAEWEITGAGRPLWDNELGRYVEKAHGTFALVWEEEG